MCGIAALFKQPQTTYPNETIMTLAQLVAHRGPDDAGCVWMNTTPNQVIYQTLPSESPWNIALSHRRLSIFDVSMMGHQPMNYQDRFWIVYNGEVYNFLELRVELERCGYTFKSNSDTEIILAAFMEWGTDCFKRFHGMWGMIIVDVIQRQATLCRDRMGIKPLYFWRNNKVIAAASEIKQFTGLPDFRAKMEVNAVKEYLQTGYEHTNQTFFQDVYPVPAGHWLQINLDNLEMGSAQSYWSPEDIQPSITHIDEAGQLFAQQLRWSVEQHLRSDVPVGSALSGGLDSSSVVMLINQIANGKSEKGLHTFTSTFPGETIDEREYVDAVLAKLKVSSHFVTPSIDKFLEDFDHFVWIHDEPVGGFSVYASYAVARLARQVGIPVTLNGQGGDEVFAGYWQSYFFHLRDMVLHGRVLEPMKHLAGSLTASGNPTLMRQIPVMLRRYMARRYPLKVGLRFTDNNHQSDLFKNIMTLSGQKRRVHEIRYMHLPRLLKWDDRNSMAFSVEGRYPFLDHSLIELCLSFDSSILYHHGWTKWPLRVGLKGLLPTKVAQRKSKFGFLTPQDWWLNPKMRMLLQNWLTSDRPIWNYVDRSDIEQLVKQVTVVKGQDQEAGEALFQFSHLIVGYICSISRARFAAYQEQRLMLMTHSTQEAPLISIVIPVQNEEAFIHRNLKAIFAQNYPQEKLEIIIVDGMSDDRTREIIQELQPSHKNLQLLNNPARFTPHALNIGLRTATGDIIIILGGHSEIEPDYVSCCVEALRTYDVNVVGGIIDTIGESYQSKAIALGMSSRFGVGDVTFRTGSDIPTLVDTVVFGAYKRSTIEQVGLFDEELIRNQDDEYNYRLRKLGGKLLFLPNIRSRYYSRGSLIKLFRQYYNYGCYKILVMLKHPYQMRPRQFVPAVFVLFIIIGSTLALFSAAIRVLWILVMAFYLAINLLFSGRIAINSRLIYFPIMPVVFAILHLSYGTGFLHGLLRYRAKLTSLPAIMMKESRK